MRVGSLGGYSDEPLPVAPDRGCQSGRGAVGRAGGRIPARPPGLPRQDTRIPGRPASGLSAPSTAVVGASPRTKPEGATPGESPAAPKATEGLAAGEKPEG